MRSSFTRIVSTLLVLFFMAACGSSSDESVAGGDTNYHEIASRQNWNDDGNYSVTFAFSKESSVGFKDGVAKSDFKLYYEKELNPTTTEEGGDDNSSVTTVEIEPIYIDDFDLNITDNTIQLSFTNPINNTIIDKNGTRYTEFVLYTDKNITTDNKQFVGEFYVTAVEYAFKNYETRGFSEVTTQREIKLTLEDGQKFATNLDKSMFVLDVDDANITTVVTRLSDNEVLLNFDNMPTVFDTSKILLTTTENAFEYNMFNYVDTYIDVTVPQAYIDQSETRYENGLLTLTIYHNSDFNGVENGISLSDDTLNIVSQSYNDESNFYKVTLSGKSSSEEYVSYLKDKEIKVKLKKDNNIKETTIHSEIVRPYIVLSEVAKPSEEHKVEVDIEPVYSLFSSDISLSDFNITRKDGISLSNLKLIKSNESVVRFSFDTPDEIVTLDVKLNNSSKLTTKTNLTPVVPIDTTLYINAYEIEAYRDPDASKALKTMIQEATKKGLGETFGLGLVSGIGSFSASTAMGFAMPYVFEEFGIKDTNMKVDEILQVVNASLDAIKDLDKNMDSQFTHLGNIVVQGNDINSIKKFKSKLVKLDTYAYNFLGDADIANFAKVTSKDSNATQAQIDEAKKKFVDKIDSMFNNSGKDAANHAIMDHISLIRDIRESIAGSQAYLGTFGVYHRLMSSVYNYGSQTIELKKAFLHDTYTIYFLNASTMYDYLKIKTPNSSLIKTLEKEMEDVGKEYKKYKEKLNKVVELNNNGGDVLYANGKEIEITKSLVRMEIVNAGYVQIIYQKRRDEWYIGWHDTVYAYPHVGLKLKDYEEMNRKSKSRNTNFIKEIQAVGIDGLYTYKNNWLFASGNPRRHFNDSSSPFRKWTYKLYQDLYVVKSNYSTSKDNNKLVFKVVPLTLFNNAKYEKYANDFLSFAKYKK